MSAGWCGMSVAARHRSGNGGLVRGNRALVRTISTGTATFEGVNLGRYGTKEGTVSGSITWECASVERL
jgi:hypothetical protein